MNKPGRLTVRGINDSYTKKIVRESTLFFINEVFSRQIIPFIDITIKATQKMDEGLDGECYPVDDEYEYRPRKFVIECRYNNDISELPSLIHTIAHEIVHCKQFAKRELTDGLNKWKGEKIPHDIDYWESPWEKEAYVRQDELFDKLIDFYSKTKDDVCQSIKYKSIEEPPQSI